MKAKRVKDRKLLDSVIEQSCVVCGRSGPSDPDHIRSKGAGGSDTANNVWPLCREHHVLRHLKGLGYMVRSFQSCRDWLSDHERTDILEKYEIK